MPRREPNPVTHHRLRLVVKDESLDAPLASLTKPESRSRLGERLFLYSVKAMEIDTNDRQPDGYSQAESAYGQYQQAVWSYSTMTWRLDNKVNIIKSDSEIIGLGLRIRLGVQAAHRLISPPMYNKDSPEVIEHSDLLPVFYKIPDVDEATERKIKFLNDAIEGGAQVNGLSLVDTKMPFRQFFQSGDTGWSRDLGRVASYDTIAPIVSLSHSGDSQSALGA